MRRHTHLDCTCAFNSWDWEFRAKDIHGIVVRGLSFSALEVMFRYINMGKIDRMRGSTVFHMASCRDVVECVHLEQLVLAASTLICSFVGALVLGSRLLETRKILRVVWQVV